MAALAECVISNKGLFLGEGIDALETLLEQFAGDEDKKTPELRSLRSWHQP